MYDLRMFTANEFSTYIRKVLDEAHISLDDVLDKEVRVQQVRKESTETANAQEMNKTRKKSSSASLSSSHRNYSNFNKRPSKVVVGDSEFFTGRIEYKLPSNSRQNSLGSDEINKSLTNENLRRRGSDQIERGDYRDINASYEKSKSDANLGVILEDDKKSDSIK
jgi:predicted secreted protein